MLLETIPIPVKTMIIIVTTILNIVAPIILIVLTLTISNICRHVLIVEV